jgi:hypothetical protein
MKRAQMQRDQKARGENEKRRTLWGTAAFWLFVVV